MIKDRSHSKLSSASSKAKIKQIIRQAMGRPSLQNKPRRSSSVKSLPFSNNNATEARKPYAYSQIKRHNSVRVMHYSPYEQSKSQVESKNFVEEGMKIKSVEWWHEKGYKLQSQTLVKQTNFSKQSIKKFLQTGKNNTKQTIFQIQNDIFTTENSQLFIFFLNADTKKMKLVQKIKTMKIEDGEYHHILIFKLKQNDMNSKENVGKPGKMDQIKDKIAKFIENQLLNGSKKIFGNLIKQFPQKSQQMIQFFGLLHLENSHQGKMITPKEQTKVIDMLIDKKFGPIKLKDSIHNSSGVRHSKNLIQELMNSKIPLSQQALQRFKK